jgi:hypothetical protein
MHTNKRKKENLIIPILKCILVFLTGYTMLEYSSFIKIPPGNTFYVILACLLMAGSLLTTYLLIKARLFSKKKKKSKIFTINGKNQKKTIEI